MNRVQKAIEGVRSRCAGKEPALLEQISKTFSLDFEEYAKLQELKSTAAMHGILTQEEAQQVYGYLGNTPEHYNRQPVEIKVALTKLFSELLALRLAKRI